MRLVTHLGRVSLLTASLAGCGYSHVTLTAEGPQQAATSTPSQINSFRASWSFAYDTVPSLDGERAVRPRTTGPDAAAANLQYLNSGLALIEANCADYFRRAGRLQQGVNVFRDITNAFAPVAAGALALGTGSARAAAILSLTQAGVSGTINTVYSDFLFDSSNIDDVRQLVGTASAAHETGVRANLSAAPGAISYEWATTQLLDHQAICQPSHILGLARLAIGNGTVLARNAGAAGDRTEPGQQAVSGVLPPRVSLTVPAPGSVAVRVSSSGSTRMLLAMFRAIPRASQPAFIRRVQQAMDELGIRGDPMDIILNSDQAREADRVAVLGRLPAQAAPPPASVAVPVVPAPASIPVPVSPPPPPPPTPSPQPGAAPRIAPAPAPATLALLARFRAVPAAGRTAFIADVQQAMAELHIQGDPMDLVMSTEPQREADRMAVLARLR